MCEVEVLHYSVRARHERGVHMRAWQAAAHAPVPTAPQPISHVLGRLCDSDVIE